jgi:probable phosphoglycerate mutase
VDVRALTLFVVRHGECEHNAEGLSRVAGQNDSPLTPRGRAQSRANGILLKELSPDLSQLGFFASSLHRACMTMELLRESSGLEPALYLADRRLMEIDCGDNTWLPWPEIEARAEKDPLWNSDRWNYVHPNGESLAILQQRVEEFLQTLLGDAVIVTHAGVIRMIRAHILGLSHQQTLDYRPPNAGIMRLSAGVEIYFGE